MQIKTDQIMENAILKRESKKLALEFEDIIRNHPDAVKSDMSNLLMSRMCLETIYLPKKVVKSYEKKDLEESDKKSDTVTIDPSQAKLEWELDEEEKKKDYRRIRAYSFGPFNPIEYFKSKLRILWLLKEPLCKNIDEINRKKIKDYRQALQYSTWGKVLEEDNPTIKKLINYTQILLKEIQKEEKKQSRQSDFANEDLDNENVVMNHICILEANHFPGLAFNGTNSNDNLVAEWHKINEELIQALVDFYDPNILIGGGTLEYYLPSKNYDTPNYEEVYKMINNGLKIVHDEIVDWSYNIAGYDPPTKSAENNGKEKVGKNVRYYGKLKDRIYIQANHPACEDYGGDFGEDFAIADAGVINERILGKSKENGGIKSPTE